MAQAEFLLQATQKRHHVTAISAMMALPNPARCVWSVAFARTSGIQLIAPSIKALPVKPRVFVGIRNDITSVQALRALLALEVDLYVVDTGSRRPIFHPKLYLVASKSEARVLIGSANLTHNGLQNNIEASALLKLDLGSKEDAAFVAQILDSLDNMVAGFPDHVLSVSTLAEAEQLFKEGRLCDEDMVVAPSTTQQAPADGGIQLPRMKLFQKPSPPKVKQQGTKQSSSGKQSSIAISKTQFVRVWQSKPLPARSLSVPPGKNANPTGAMGLTQGGAYPVNFRTYFRHDVFAELAWQPTTKEPFKESASASFELIIENISHGIFQLKLTHDNRDDTASAKQHQAPTSLQWGEAAKLIKRPDLLGRTLYLYKKAGTPPTYLIEID